MSNLSELFPTGGGGIELIRTDIITATGTYTKPSDVEDTDVAFVEMWGGGASGNANDSSGNAEGGMPGSWVLLRIKAAELPSSIPVVIGSGGVPVTASSSGVLGIAGGDTSFLLFTAYGGMPAPSTPAWQPKLASQFSPSSSNFPFYKEIIKWEFPISDSGSRIIGLGGNNPSPVDTLHRGGWGGGAQSSGSSYPGQSSILGGSGGQGARSRERLAGAGQTPGGGGGGGTGVASGAGARGEIRVHYYRGVSF